MSYNYEDFDISELDAMYRGETVTDRSGNSVKWDDLDNASKTYVEGTWDDQNG
ncbi:hypothetical protein FACS1894167_02460 [Synergistales bacterium]|nr:hypothetical protein FACS1894167_02460 [Synergistales bacterium]GHV53355.1 hypothetical protein FACS1894216_11200 [Synergistales bacterium]